MVYVFEDYGMVVGQFVLEYFYVVDVQQSVFVILQNQCWGFDFWQYVVFLQVYGWVQVDVLLYFFCYVCVGCFFFIYQCDGEIGDVYGVFVGLVQGGVEIFGVVWNQWVVV